MKHLRKCAKTNLKFRKGPNTFLQNPGVAYNKEKNSLKPSLGVVSAILILILSFLDPEDINECSMQGVCQNGDCLNTLGSFKCSCKSGFVLERNRCVGEYKPSLAFFFSLLCIAQPQSTRHETIVPNVQCTFGIDCHNTFLLC